MFKKTRQSFSKKMLSALLSVWVGAFIALPAAFGMPPHPDLLKQFKEGIKPIPNFITNPQILREKGINQPDKKLELAEYIQLSEPVPGPTGNYKALALLVDFSDNTSQVTASYFDTLIFSSGSNSVRDYYYEVSYGSLTIITVNLPSSVGWSRAPQTYSYYTNGAYGLGSYPRNAQKLVEDVVDAVDSVVDFSQYDNDGDGSVDALFVIHAGQGAEYTGNPNDIWSHKWSITPRLKDGVQVSNYSMEPEYWASPGDMTLGVYCHELGHVFGLPDLYDYDNTSEGIGVWSLMASGSWNGYLGSSPAHLDAWCRTALGFATPTVITSNTPGLPITAVENQGQIYYLWDCGTPNNEYFLVENRQAIGYDSALPNFGLCIWHIDDSKSNNDKECRNHQNCNCSNHYLVALEQADGDLDLEYGINRGDGGDPYPGSTNNRTFNFASTPNSGSYVNCNSQVAITNISNSAVTMTADVEVCGQAPSYTINIDQLRTKNVTDTWDVIFTPGETIIINEAITIQGDPGELYNFAVRCLFIDSAGTPTLLGKEIYRNQSPGTYYISLQSVIPAGAALGRGTLRSASVLIQNGTVLDRGNLSSFVNIE
jgi:immune inhibitor A